MGGKLVTETSRGQFTDTPVFGAGICTSGQRKVDAGLLVGLGRHGVDSPEILFSLAPAQKPREYHTRTRLHSISPAYIPLSLKQSVII